MNSARLIFSVLCFTLALDNPGGADGLTGPTRNSFVEASFKSCFKSQTSNPLNTSLKADAISQYCLCFSNRLADSTSPDELKELDELTLREPSAVAAKMHPLIKSIGDYCRSHP